jgi:hypothetical protein
VLTCRPWVMMEVIAVWPTATDVEFCRGTAACRPIVLQDGPLNQLLADDPRADQAGRLACRPPRRRTDDRERAGVVDAENRMSDQLGDGHHVPDDARLDADDTNDSDSRGPSGCTQEHGLDHGHRCAPIRSCGSGNAVTQIWVSLSGESWRTVDDHRRLRASDQPWHEESAPLRLCADEATDRPDRSGMRERTVGGARRVTQTLSTSR